MPQSIMDIELLISRVASLTVGCRGVNISLTINKPIWKLSNEKSVRLRYSRYSVKFPFCCFYSCTVIY